MAIQKNRGNFGNPSRGWRSRRGLPSRSVGVAQQSNRDRKRRKPYLSSKRYRKGK